MMFNLKMYNFYNETFSKQRVSYRVGDLGIFNKRGREDTKSEGEGKQRGGKGKRKGSGTDRRTDRQKEKNRHEHIQSRFATDAKVTWSES